MKTAIIDYTYKIYPDIICQKKDRIILKENKMKAKPISILTVKVAVNGRSIDDVKIQNIGRLNKYGEYKYQVKTKHYDFFVWHDRKKSWYWLMEKVIEKIRKSGG